MDRKTRNKIKQLKKQKKYDEIFVYYGKKAYKKYVPTSYRDEDLERLKEEGRYEEIFNKYDKKDYESLLIHARAQEMKEAGRPFKADVWEFIQEVKRTIKRFGINAIFTTSAFMLANTNMQQGMIYANAQKYEDEIKAYHENITKYAEKVKAMHLNDLQVIMKVMDDMWKSIKGYGTPAKDIYGFLELDLEPRTGMVNAEI